MLQNVVQFRLFEPLAAVVGWLVFLLRVGNVGVDVRVAVDEGSVRWSSGDSRERDDTAPRLALFDLLPPLRGLSQCRLQRLR